MNKKRRFGVELIKFFAAQLILALEFLHEDLEIVFKDLKPDNILLDQDGHILLTEFGFTKGSLDSNQLDDFTKVSRNDKLCYVAPEIIKGNSQLTLKGEQYSYKADIWSLGCILYDFFAGAPAFYHEDPEQIKQKILRGDFNLPEDIGKEGTDLITKLLKINVSLTINRSRKKDWEP